MADVTHDKYRITWLNGKAQATWTEGKGDSRKRPRVELRDHDDKPFRKDTSDVKLRAALVAFAARQSKVEVQKNGTTVAAVLKAYQEHRIADGKQEHPIGTQIKAINKFFGAMDPRDVTEELCKQYAAQRAFDDEGKQIIANSTVLSELTRLSTGLRWAAKRQVVAGWKEEADVPVMWFPQASEPRDRYLTQDEALKLINATVERHTRLFILLALYTGARKTAILELTWDRVDFEAAKVNYKAPVVTNLLVKKVKKGRGTPPIPVEVLNELRMAKEDAKSSHVIEFEGKPVKWFRTSFEATVTRAGLTPPVTPHTLRHTFSTWCEEMGVPAAAVARALGHKKETTTKENYQHAQTEAARPAVEAVAAKMRLHAIKGGKV